MTASSPKGTAGSARLWQKQVMALIAKEDYWAGRPDYQIFKWEGEQVP